MPLTIISPKHSFVNFNGGITDFILPAYQYFATAFQFMLPVDSGISPGASLTVGVEKGGISYNYGHTAQNVCSWGRITGVNFNTDFPLTIPAAQPIAAGTYATSKDFFAAIRTSLDLSVYSADFLQCCDANTQTNRTFTFNSVKTGHINFYKGLQQVIIPEADNSNFALTNAGITDCFRYVVSDGVTKVYSNKFKRVYDNKFLTKVTYSNNEDGFGFKFRSADMFNMVWLPFEVKHPQYPSTQSVYIKSSNVEKVTSAVIQQEWEFITAYMPKSIHEKIITMLSMDNKYFKGSRIDGAISKKADYSIEWVERVEYAQAKCKVSQAFEGRNSNCEKRVTC